MTQEEKSILALFRNMINDRPSELHFVASDDGETVLWTAAKKGKFKIGEINNNKFDK